MPTEEFFDFFCRIEDREALLAEVASLLEPGEHILDIATGSGYLAQQMTRQKVVCVDLDSPVIKKTATVLPGTYVCADATNLPFKDASFDSTVAWTGAAHVPDWKGLFSEMARVTKKGGRIITAEPIGDYSTRAFRDIRCSHPMPSPNKMTEELQKYGNVKTIEKDYFAIILARLG